MRYDFIHQPATDDTVDPAITLAVGLVPTRVSIQDSRAWGAGLSIVIEDEDSVTFVHEGISTLRYAKALAIRAYEATR